tara:strand:+ start:26293 stop:26715 length:423 start_codon:yes stop_codon:yes gene_type:complete
MKIELTVKKEFEVKTLLVEANVRYWEDATVNGVEDENGDLIPCKLGDTWKPIIDLETGLITNWEKGKEADIHYKVCDAGEYWLQDENGEKIVKAKGYYVPDFLAIDDSGLGDYIIMKVDKDGKINNWRFDSEPFTNEDED